MDDPNKTMPPQRPHDEVSGDAQTMPGKRDRKPDGRFEPGDLIMERYKVLAELGQGGMGVVYKCFDETAGIEIALKALPPELSHNTLEMEDIKENFQLVHNLHHPNIASSNNLEKDNANGNYYLIMECVEGEDLRRWIKSRRRENALNLQTVLPIIRKVASALDYAHEQKIIHRDIKPGNIMIDSAGHVKVLDFGLAAQIHTSMTRVSMAYHGTSGTGPYMAPEQWRGRAQGAAADQYALAVMTYEMLAGHLPFESTDAAVLREAVLNDTPEELPDMPACVRTAITKGMSKDPAERFASCADFVAALEGKKVFGIKRSGKKGLRIAAGILILLVAIGIMSSLFQDDERKQPAEEQAQSKAGDRPRRTTETQSPVPVQVPPPRQEAAGTGSNTDKEFMQQLQAAYNLQTQLSQLKTEIEAANLDRGQTFGKHIDAFSVNFATGAQALKNREVEVANASFQTAKQEAVWLVQNVPLRKRAQELKATAISRKKEADEYDALKWSKVAYQTASKLTAAGEKAYESGDFNVAAKNFETGGQAFRTAATAAMKQVLANHITAAKKARSQKNWDLFWSYIEKIRPLDEKTADSLSDQAKIEIKNQKIASLFSVARNADRKKNWEQVYDSSLEILSLSPDNSEAKKLFDKAKIQIKPFFQFHGVINGKKIKNVSYSHYESEEWWINDWYGSSWCINDSKPIEIKQTKDSWGKVEKKEYRYTLKYKDKNGDEYVGSLFFVSDWSTGLKEFSVPLSKIDRKRFAEDEKKGFGFSDNYRILKSVPINTTQYDIPSGVISIGENAFKDRKLLQRVTIPSSVIVIDKEAFSGCVSLKDIKIPSSVISIGRSAFEDCKSLTKISIPKEITYISKYVFRHCESLEKVIMPPNETVIGTGAFSFCKSLKIEIPATVTSIGNYAFVECHSLKNIEIPSSVHTIGKGAFARCSSLQSVKMEKGIEAIESCAFEKCTALKNVILPSDITIGKNAFEYCLSLDNLTIPPGVKIGQYAFYRCKSLKKVIISKNVQIDRLAFCEAGCEAQVKHLCRDNVYISESFCPDY